MFKTFETPILNGKQNSLTGPVITGSFEKRAPGLFITSPDHLAVMAGNYCVSAPRGKKSRMRNSWDCPFNRPIICRLKQSRYGAM